MKKLLLVILLLVATTTFAQKVTFTPNYYDGGISYFGYWSAIDTSATYRSEYFDITPFDGQTLYLTYNYNTGNTTGSLKCYIQGIYGDGIMTMDLDTLTLTSANGYTGTQVIPSISGFAPLIRVTFTSSGNTVGTQSKSLRMSFYARSNDPIYKLNKSWYQ